MKIKRSHTRAVCLRRDPVRVPSDRDLRGPGPSGGPAVGCPWAHLWGSTRGSSMGLTSAGVRPTVTPLHPHPFTSAPAPPMLGRGGISQGKCGSHHGVSLSLTVRTFFVCLRSLGSLALHGHASALTGDVQSSVRLTALPVIAGRGHGSRTFPSGA